MATQNFDAFKPLNEQEEKQIKGGGSQGENPQCQHIMDEMQILQQEIQAANAQGQPTQNLVSKVSSLQMAYQQCISQPIPTN